MTTTIIALQDLAQRISQQEAELNRLRQELEARQTRLATLTNQKAELEAQLRQVENEIQAVGQGIAPISRPTTPTTTTVATPAPLPTGLSLPQLLLQLVEEAGRPMTTKDLAQELVRRAYPTTSKNIPGLVETRVRELMKKGLLLRAGDMAGVILAPGTPSPTAASGRGSTSPQANGPTKAPVPEPTTAPSVAVSPGSAEVPPLADLLEELLRQSSGPVKARELAEQALGRGYETRSQDFVSVVWAALAKMPNVENVPGKGYRLKKPRGSRSGR